MEDIQHDENEYIILNCREDAEEQEEKSNGDKYLQLAQYQYFDFEAIRKSMQSRCRWQRQWNAR